MVNALIARHAEVAEVSESRSGALLVVYCIVASGLCVHRGRQRNPSC